MRSVLKPLMAALALVGCVAERPVPAAGSNPPFDSASPTIPYTRLYVFGDSYSDIGAGYIDGNGPTAVAYLGWLMGLKIASSQAPHAPERSLVFAVSGAGSGDGQGRRVKEALLGYGMLNQVRDFASRVQSGDIRFDPQSTLFFIAGGLNDGRLQSDQTVANLRRLIETIRDLGGRHVTVAQLPTKIPPFAAVALRLNPALQQFADREGRSLGVDLWMNHWGQGFDDVMEHPAAYGIANTTDACAGRALFDQDPTPIGDPATFFFYHEGHPSTAVHRIVGGKLFEEIKAHPPGIASPLAGTAWQLVKFEGGDGTVRRPDSGSKYTIAFTADGHLAARIDCNRGRATWKSSGPSQLELGPMALTRAMCPPDSMHDQIVKQWGSIRSYVIRDGHLFLSLMADGGIYEYEPMAAAPGADPKSPVGSKVPQ